MTAGAASGAGDSCYALTQGIASVRKIGKPSHALKVTLRLFRESGTLRRSELSFEKVSLREEENTNLPFRSSYCISFTLCADCGA